MPSTDYVLAFDFGEKRIGVAGGSLQLGIATPLTTIHALSNQQRFQTIRALIEQWQPQQLLVGLPCFLDGKPHRLSSLAQRFGQRLQGRFQLPVTYVDERLSSIEAATLLHEVGIHQQKDVIDQIAAMRILQAWFDSLKTKPRDTHQ